MNIRAILLVILTIFWYSKSRAQRSCGTAEYMNQYGNIDKKKAFEKWIDQKKKKSFRKSSSSSKSHNISVYEIPVVVHIIHNGEPVGVGSNISDKQIMSQLQVLNEDFGKKNADSISIPEEFKGVYADIGFEFVLARSDPNRKSTSGITRTKGVKKSWTPNDNIALKSMSYWPSDDYLNIWVATMKLVLGYAQFPKTDLLLGMDFYPSPKTTDGIVIDFTAFGSKKIDPKANLDPPFNLGRTATHELGHFFGLRHIWGDNDVCSIGDFVEDTPESRLSSSGCPELGISSTTCGSQDMFMNYMDYSDDLCATLFTRGQKERMITIIENSPQRRFLTSSLGLFRPNFLTRFISPDIGVCSNILTPIIEFKNTASYSINTTTLLLYINDTLKAEKTFPLNNLGVNQTAELVFDNIYLNDFGIFEIKAEVKTFNNKTNGLYDDYATIKKKILRLEHVDSLSEDFSSNNTLWTIRTNQETSLLKKKQTIFYSNTNNAMSFDYYENGNSIDALISPNLSLGSASKKLIFDYIFSYKADTEDTFTVKLSTDCGSTISSTLFSSLKEISKIESPVAFFPSSATDWNHAQIDLSEYTNQNITFLFEGNSLGSNRILFDNIRVVDNSYNDIALVGLANPPILCNTNNELSLLVENKGAQLVNNLDLQLQQGAVVSTVSYPQLNLLPGERIAIPLSIPAINTTMKLAVSLLNEDNNNNNNHFTQIIIPNTPSQNIPFREQFNTSYFPEGWFFLGSDTEQGWAINKNKVELITSENLVKGSKKMIILPPLDLTNLLSASMHFDLAYTFNGVNEELMRVKASSSCEENYETLFIQGGKKLATNYSVDKWFPTSNNRWKDIYIDLSKFAGESKVQIIIEIISAKGNNAFIRNIELFDSNIVTPKKLAENTLTIYPNPSINKLNISYRLEKVQPATLSIYTANGLLLYRKKIDYAFNQTYQISTTTFQSGLYFMQLSGKEISLSKSFMVTN